MEHMQILRIIQTTKNAIQSLSNPSETLTANKYLVDFEKSMIAWEISELLIKEDDNTFQFFGAKFLYSKIQKQFYQLNDMNNGENVLLQSIIQNIMQLSKDNNLNVCRYLCLSLAALTLQMKQVGIINQILIWLNPIITTSPIILLELLIVLPEEATNYQIAVSSSTRDQFINQLSGSANDVLTFLSTLWQQVISNTKSNSTTIQSKILRCTWKWIDATNIQSSVILAQPIYQYILQSLFSEEIELFESAIDAIIIIYKVEYVRNFQNKSMNIIETSMSSILATRKIWSNLQQQHRAMNPSDIDEDDINLYRIICRLFTEVSESMLNIFIDLKLSNINMGQVDIINQLLACAMLRIDPAICRIPLKFFYELAMNIKVIEADEQQNVHDDVDDLSANRINHQDDDDGGGYNLKQSNVVRMELNKMYSSIYQHLLDIAINHIQLPMEVLLGQVPNSEVNIDSRLEWKETIIDCCYVLGSNRCIELLCIHLQNSSNNTPNTTTNNSMDYSKIEGALFAIQQISGYLSKSESIFTPQILNFASSLPQNMPKLRITVIELFSCFSFWFALNTSHITLVLSQLFQDLQQPTTAQPAAVAILNIFRTCSHLPGLPIEQLLHFMNTMKATSIASSLKTSSSNSSVFSLDVELLLLEAIVVALSSLPQKESEAGFHAISIPIVQSLTQLLQQPQPPQSSSDQHISTIDSSMLIPYIDRITIIFQYYKSSHNSSFATELFISLIPLFTQILQICTTEKIAERVCRCYKHSIRNLTKHFGTYLSIMTNHLSLSFSKSPYSAYLYAASICISTFALTDNGIHVEILYQMLWNMSNTFFQVLTDIKKFEDHPDMVEEYFFLMAKTLRYCPLPFILTSKQQLNTIISAAIIGLSLKHREAQKGILLFFERFVQLSTYWNENSNDINAKQYNQLAKDLIIQYATSLLQAIFTLLSGIMPAYALDESNGCISDVLYYLKKRFSIEFKEWLLTIIIQLSEIAQKVATNQNFIENLHNSKSKSEFCSILDQFESTCRRSL